MTKLAYVSTRGRDEPIPYLETVIAGLARDGGLFVPERFPQIEYELLRQMQEMEHWQIISSVIALLAPDLPAEVRDQMCREGYTAERFKYGVRGYNPAEIMPLHFLTDTLALAEQANGPSQAFKDHGMTKLAPTMAYRMSMLDLLIRILGATSGDTGSAGLIAMVPHKIPTFILSPQEGMSRYQQVQMWGVNSPYAFNLAVNAGFTQCQDIAKSIFADHGFRDEYGLTTLNSINWVRIAAQVSYMFAIYAKTGVPIGEPVRIVIPSGNAGHSCAAFIAKQMGLPISIVIATNENDLLYRLVRTGVYQPYERTITTSPSMDIETASNFERMLYWLYGMDSERVTAFHKELNVHGKAEIDKSLFQRSDITADRICRHGVDGFIQMAYEQHNVIIDPHTAVAYGAAQSVIHDGMMTVVLETAQPVKFDATITRVLGIEPLVPLEATLDGLACAPTHEVRIEPDADQVMRFIEEHA